MAAALQLGGTGAVRFALIHTTTSQPWQPCIATRARTCDSPSP
jgi:hypothetical protein